MVQQAVETDQKPVFTPPSAAEVAEPRAYLRANAEILRAMSEGRIEPVQAKRMTDMIREQCEDCCGVSMAEAAREQKDPILQLIEAGGLMECSEDLLRKVEEAVQHVTDVRMTAGLKKKFHELVDRIVALQRQAREDPVIGWCYYGRDSETGDVFHMAAVHCRFFEIWNDTDYPNSLIMAPPGHAKSTSLRGQIVWEIGRTPELRCLILYDEKNKAKKEVLSLRQIIRSACFRAVFPDVRVLGRDERAEDSGWRFTVARRNTFSREPTVEGAGIQSRLNGAGFDRIFGDDFNPPDVADQPSLRRTIDGIFWKVISERLRNPKNARIRLICTPWHEKDTSGRIQDMASKGKAKRWRVGVDEFRIKDNDKGLAIPIWPERFTTEFYEERKEVLLHDYTMNYRLMARDTHERNVSRVAFYHSVERHPLTTRLDKALLAALRSKLAERWLSIDPAATDGKASSDVGVIDAVITPKGYGYISDAWMHHYGAVEMQGWLVEQITRAISEGCPYQYIYIEAQGGIKGQASLWVDHIRKWLTQNEVPESQHPTFITEGTLFGFRNNVGKEKRLKEAAGYLQNGWVKFAGVRHEDPRVPKDNPRRYYQLAIHNSPIERLAESIIAFDPNGKNDGVDAVTQWVLKNASRLQNPNAEPTAAPVERPDTRSPLKRAYDAQHDRAEAEMEEPESGYDDEAEFMARSVA